MKCPYPDCQKDYNDEKWNSAYDDFVPNHKQLSMSEHDRGTLNRVYLKSRQCRFCARLFHEVSVGNEEYEHGYYRNADMDFLFSYPASKTRFESKNIPQDVRDAFNEAERCRATGALTGTSACLRKCIYAVCDDLKLEGTDYKEKIVNLPVTKMQYKELLKQVKFLGDNMTKPSGIVYSKEEIDISLEVLPIVLDDLYSTDERISSAEKLLAKIRSKNPKEKKSPEIVQAAQ